MSNDLGSKAQNVRLDWIDAIKGICIISVVIYHVTLGLHDSGILEGSNLLDVFWVYITAVATPPFFIVSGFFIKKSLEKHGYFKFLCNSVHFILLPYALWSIIQVMAKMVFFEYVNKEAEFDLLNLLVFQPTGQFWFLQALFIGQILFILIHKFYNQHYFLLFVFTALVSLCLYHDQTFSQDIRGLALLLLGAFAYETKAHTRLKGPITNLLCLFFFVISGTVYYYYLVPMGLQSASNIIGGIASTILLSNLFMSTRGSKILAYLGKYSMYIFVFHLLCLVPFRVLLKKLSIVDPVLTTITCTLAGVFLPLLGALILEKLRISQYLGFRHVGAFDTKPHEANLRS